MSIEQELLARVKRLEDIEEIRNLKHAYCRACDAHYDADAIAMLLCEDAVWDGGNIGLIEGREAIREFFAGSSQVVPFAVHFVANGVVAVDADLATGEWDLWQPMVFNRAGGEEAFWFVARYEDKFRRTAEGWRIARITATTRMLTPYEVGFAKIRILPEYPGSSVEPLQ